MIDVGGERHAVAHGDAHAEVDVNVCFRGVVVIHVSLLLKQGTIRTPGCYRAVMMSISMRYSGRARALMPTVVRAGGSGKYSL